MTPSLEHQGNIEESAAKAAVLEQKEVPTLQLIEERLTDFQKENPDFNPANFVDLAKDSFDKSFANSNLKTERLSELFDIFLKSRTGMLTGKNLISFPEMGELVEGMTAVPDERVKKLAYPFKNILDMAEKSPFPEVDDFIGKFKKEHQRIH